MMPTVRFRDGAASWLLGVAVLCLVAQTSLLPILAPGAAVWDPGHAHFTLNGVVPSHRHVLKAEPNDGVGCILSSEAGAADVQQGKPLACSPNSQGAVGAAPVLLGSPGAVHIGAPDDLWRPVPQAASAAWADAALDIPTPPPRGHA